MTGHEKECALAALALLIEQSRKANPKRGLAALQNHYREIAATICDDDDFPPTQIPLR